MIRVMAYNLYFGGSDRVEAILAVLDHCQADLICLTEADNPLVIQRLADRLGYNYVWARGSGDRHIALLSRYPVAGWAVYNRRPLTQVVLEVTLDLSTAPGRQPTRTLTLYNAHFLPYLLLPFEARRWQAVGKLLEVIRDHAPGPHLILGDLNAIAPGDRVLQHRNPLRMRRLMLLQLGFIFRLSLPRLLAAGYVDCFRHLNPGEDGFTWMPENRTTRYDYILADGVMAGRLLSCRVVDGIEAVARASDHLPILAEFDL